MEKPVIFLFISKAFSYSLLKSSDLKELKNGSLRKSCLLLIPNSSIQKGNDGNENRDSNLDDKEQTTISESDKKPDI